MIVVTLKHVHTVRRQLWSGEWVRYHYAWKGKGAPRLKGKPGSPEFLASYNEAWASRKQPLTGTLDEVISRFRASPEFQRLGAHTKRAYQRHLDTIAQRFGDMPLRALDDPRVRRHFLTWRDEMSSTPRAADYSVGTLKRLLAWAVERVLIASNQAAPIGKLHKADRADQIWQDEDFARLKSVASREVYQAVQLAAFTGLRQSDLIGLTWSAYDGSAFTLRTAKRGKVAIIPAIAACRELVGEIPKRQLTILTSARSQRPWTADGLRSSFGKACRAAGVKRTFHDLRRTAATNLLKADIDAPAVALIMGWEERAVEALKRRYVSRKAVIASLVRRLDAGNGVLPIANRAPKSNGSGTAAPKRTPKSAPGS